MSQRTLDSFIDCVRGGLIVSCQALPHEPLYGAQIMARMAVAAQEGGAVGIRANTPADIAAIRAAVTLPIVGLYKVVLPGFDVYITPTVASAQEVAAAGADVIAVDATQRPRPNYAELADFFAAVRAATGCLILADISTAAEGLAAEAAGADLVSTTMSGYTPYSPQLPGPDLAIVRELATQLKAPLLAEGRYHTPEQVRLALDAGATAVVVGGAITRPQEITRRFVSVLDATIVNATTKTQRNHKGHEE